MKERIRVLIVDDHILLRQAASQALRTDPSIEVVGEASNGKEAIEKAKDLMPHVVLMDLIMPEIDGIKATEEITKASPHVSVIILTVSDSGKDLARAFKAGAIRYLTKNATPAELREAVKSAYQKEAILPPAIAADLTEEEPTSLVNILTEREIEVLKLIAKGLDNKVIAKEIFASTGTVKNHVSNILTKLQLENRTQAAVEAALGGLVTSSKTTNI